MFRGEGSGPNGPAAAAVNHLLVLEPLSPVRLLMTAIKHIEGQDF